MSAREPAGVIVVNKPLGMTSHDVVARVRRLLGTRRVGHAGTLDPMAQGVLVVLVGEATKLAPYLTAADKVYIAHVTFGRATDTLDAEGRTTEVAEVPAWLQDEIEWHRDEGQGSGSPRLDQAVAAELARTEQVPPAYSAIQVDGRRSYNLARAGEAVALAPRPVAVRYLSIVCAHLAEPRITLQLGVSKGYYVRSLARDLGERLGVPAHLSWLHRLVSGDFKINDWVALDAGAGALRAALIPMAEAAARSLPVGRLTTEGAERARQGKRLGVADFTDPPPVADASAWLDPEGRLVAIGRAVGRAVEEPGAEGGAVLSILRGFAP
jgi:tRNA pseudouridine55 synthase